MTAAGSSPRVLLVGGALEGGGAERRLTLLHKHMFGGDVDLAVLKGSPEPRPRTFYLGWTGTRSYPRVIWALRNILRKGRYDAVMSMSIYPSAVSKLAIMLSGMRTVLIATENNRPTKLEEQWGKHWRSHVLSGLGRWIYGGSDLFAANSVDGLSESIQHYGVRPERAVRIHNLLPIEELQRSAEQPSPELDGEPEGPVRICVAARLDGTKRTDSVINAVAGLPADLNVRLWILGDGSARPRLEQQAQTLNLGDKVRFFGWVSNPSRLLKKADIYVQASMFEGFSNAVIEAMALGVAVITSTSTSDALDMVERGAAAGFEPGDVEGLRQQILRLARDPEARAELNRAAQPFIQPLRPEIAIKGYEALAERAMALYSA